jgi:L-histidine N-alpha-methyltransferase
MDYDNNSFMGDVLAGLSSDPKTLPSKYFYDKQGDKIFQQIMELDEYYLTRAEMDIFQTQKNEILSIFQSTNSAFNLIEFGAGDGSKTKVLLKHFQNKSADFTYLPIDISQNVLDQLMDTLNQEIPDLKTNALQGDYFEALSQLDKSNHARNIVMFLGSNIGNFTPDGAVAFLSDIREKIFKDDLLFIGIDLKKNPHDILSAYNDSQNVTKEFNLNLLRRINRELGANFDVDTFIHYPTYNPINGECLSTILSKKEQEVTIADQNFHFEMWESIHTEISRKYSEKQITKLAEKCGFVIEKNLLDSKKQFVDSIWRAV